jgi:DNA-binding beta-propeller fold protein YncE
VNFKKDFSIITITILIAVLFTGCFLLGRGGPGGDTHSKVEFDSSYWGTWLRLDREEYYYFSSNKLIVTTEDGTEIPLTITEANQDSVTFNDTGNLFDWSVNSDITIEKDVTLENLLRTTIDIGSGSSRTYFFRKLSGKKASFTGQVLEHQDLSIPAETAALQSKGISTRGGNPRGFSLGALGSVRMIVQNLNNEEDQQEVVSDEQGDFEVDEIIPEDTYNISIPEENVSVDIKLREIEEDIGIITVAETPYNFKASYSVTDSPTGNYLYAGADEEEVLYEYGIDVIIENIGIANGEGLDYTITPSADLIVIEGDLSGELATVPIGGKTAIPLQVRRDAIESGSLDFVDEEFSIVLSETDGTSWQDHAYLRFNRKRFFIEVIKLYSQPLQGIILSPDEKAQATWLKGADLANPNHFREKYHLPYRTEGYDIIIYPSVEGEVKYLISVNNYLALLEALDLPDLTEDVYESNNTETTAAELGWNTNNSAIISHGDVDYYHIQPAPDAPPPDITSPGEVTGLRAVPGDTEVTLHWLDPDDEDLRLIVVTIYEDGLELDWDFVSKGSNSETFPELQNNIEYTFLVQTEDWSSNRSPGEEIIVIPGGANAGATSYEYSFSIGKDESELVAAAGKMKYPEDVAVDSGGNVYIADTGNNRVQVFDSAGAHIAVWGADGGDGSPGTGEGEFNAPAGIGVNSSDQVYVADTGNNRIQIFDTDGTFAEVWGAGGGDGTSGSGDKEFNGPYGIHFDGNDNIYIADKGNDRIQKYTQDGTYLATIDAGGTLSSPTGLAIDSSGIIYVVERDSNRISILDTSTDSSGQITGTWPDDLRDPPGPYPTFNLYWPHDIVIDGNGYVFFSVRENNLILRYNPADEVIEKWGAAPNDYFGSPAGSNDAEFSRPSGLSLDGSGNLFVADRDNHRFQKLDYQGGFLAEAGGSSYRTGQGEFNYPEDVAADSNGNIYISDSANNRIQKFDSTGSFISMWGRSGGDGSYGTGDGEFKYPADLEVDGDNNLYVNDSGNHRILKFTPDGTYITGWGNNGGDGTSGTGNGEFNSPADLCIDTAGNVYVADNSNNRVQAFTSSGVFIDRWEPGLQYWADDSLVNPSGIAFNSNDGSFYIIRYSTYNTVVRFDSDFVHQNNITDSDHRFGAGDIETDSAGNVFLCGSESGDETVIRKMSSLGSIITDIGAPASFSFQSLSGIYVDADETVYAVDRNAHKVYVFAPVGSD